MLARSALSMMAPQYAVLLIGRPCAGGRQCVRSLVGQPCAGGRRGFGAWCGVAGVMLLAAAAAPTRAQCPPEWVQRFDVPAARVRPGMAYDSQRGVVVLLGGDNDVPEDEATFRQVWEWDGARWNHRSDVTGGPEFLEVCEMTYDSWRGVMVVRALRGQSPRTWEFDGQAWTLRASGGPTGADVSMTFDSRHGVAVLHAADGVGTWEWDGSAWLFRASGPEGLFELKFDENRGVTVALGVDLANEGQTWEWDGQSWKLVYQGGPPPRVQSGMAYDAVRREVLIFGGRFGNTHYDDAWAWDGKSWRFVSAGEPSKRAFHGMAYDAARDRMVVFGGEPGPNQLMSDTWTFDGDTWTLADEGEPQARYAYGMAYDRTRSEAVMFSGAGALLGDTWLHDGSRWRLASTGGPSRRQRASMAYDEGRAVSVLFAGADSNDPADAATWEWNGGTWSLRATSGPPPRYSAPMAYDSARQVTVLFGGFAGITANSYFDDTWEWDGATWTRRPVAGPSPRSGSAIAYDRDRGVIVLFGGFYQSPQGANTYHGDTWEWDGAAWTRVSQSGPVGRLSGSMVYDEAGQRAMLFGGLDAAGRELNDLWGWDGATWTELASSGPSARWAAGAVYVPERQSVLLFGGRKGVRGMADTWEASSPRLLGDLDCDCELTAFDIEPFVLALVDPAGYETVYPNCFRDRADLNEDGRVDVFDIEPFAEALVP